MFISNSHKAVVMIWLVINLSILGFGTAWTRWVLLEYYTNMCYPPLAKSGTDSFTLLFFPKAVIFWAFLPLQFCSFLMKKQSEHLLYNFCMVDVFSNVCSTIGKCHFLVLRITKLNLGLSTIPRLTSIE